MIISSALGIVGYGLVLMTKTVRVLTKIIHRLWHQLDTGLTNFCIYGQHIAVMLLMQFLTGLTTTGIYSVRLQSPPPFTSKEVLYESGFFVSFLKRRIMLYDTDSFNTIDR